MQEKLGKTVARWCVIGFCWGGLAVERLALANGNASDAILFERAASVHGVHNAEKPPVDEKVETPPYSSSVGVFEAARRGAFNKNKACKIEYHTVPGDDSFPPEAMEALRAAGATVEVYEGMEHGFAVRGDFKGDKNLRESADRCFERCVSLFRS